jgi:dihydrofolate synthase/folylpolyglutamate synthase
MFSRMGSAAFKKDITNIRILCEHLGNPQTKFKSIHVGGTNGKGSVSHMLAAIFQASGYKTGLHTSPHLYDFRERIKLNGELVSEEFVVDFVEQIKPLAEKIEPSFFEITVAMAFQFFVEQKVDIAIIEVGLGGRLDSTNIITPELSIITNIGWDHMNILGNTFEEIAAEKAGIIKQHIPVVIGESLAETKPVFEKIALEKKASMHFAEDMFEMIDFELKIDGLNIHYKQKDGNLLDVKTDLTGIYQLKNVRTVLTARQILQGQHWKLVNNAAALQEVKKSTGLGGRWEIIHNNPTIVLEVAHNKNGIEQMLFHLQQLSFRQLHIIIGMVKDKDVEEIFSLLPTHAVYYFTQAHIPRALPANELKQKAKTVNLIGDEYDDVNKALNKALEKAGKEDIIIVCGSIFLVAEVDKSVLCDNNN